LILSLWHQEKEEDKKPRGGREEEKKKGKNIYPRFHYIIG